MIRVKFSAPDNAQWRDWVQRTRKARSQMRAGAAVIDAKLYKEQRAVFLDAFHQKCAYCESRIVKSERFGDVDHYRPKGRVAGIDGKAVFSPDKVHSGYYWLAYSWHNLLPSCPACNRVGTGPSGLKSGKWDKFPTANQFWAETARDIRKERPLLLNRWRDYPEAHLVYDGDRGIVGPRSPRGSATIEVLGLNRDGLPEGRKGAYKNALDIFRAFYEALARSDEPQLRRRKAQLIEIQSGRAEFSAIKRVGLNMAGALYRQNLALWSPDKPASSP